MNINKILLLSLVILVLAFGSGIFLLNKISINEISNTQIPVTSTRPPIMYPRISAPYPSISTFNTRSELDVEVTITDSKIELTNISRAVEVSTTDIIGLKIGFKNRSTKDCMLKLVTDLGGLEAVWAPAGIVTYDNVFVTHPLTLHCTILSKKVTEGEVIVRTTTPGVIRDPNTSLSEEDPAAFFIVFKGKKPGAYIVKVGIESKDFPSVETLQLPVILY